MGIQELGPQTPDMLRSLPLRGIEPGILEDKNSMPITGNLEVISISSLSYVLFPIILNPTNINPTNTNWNNSGEPVSNVSQTSTQATPSINN